MGDPMDDLNVNVLLHSSLVQRIKGQIVCKVLFVH